MRLADEDMSFFFFFFFEKASSMHIMRRERLLKVRQVTHSGKISLKNYKHVRRGSGPVQLEILRQLSFQYRLGSRAICQHFLLLPCW